MLLGLETKEIPADALELGFEVELFAAESLGETLSRGIGLVPVIGKTDKLPDTDTLSLLTAYVLEDTSAAWALETGLVLATSFGADEKVPVYCMLLESERNDDADVYTAVEDVNTDITVASAGEENVGVGRDVNVCSSVTNVEGDEKTDAVNSAAAPRERHNKSENNNRSIIGEF